MVVFPGGANCSESNLWPTSDIRDFNVNPSITLESWSVDDIGLKSSSKDLEEDTLGMGTKMERFN